MAVYRHLVWLLCVVGISTALSVNPRNNNHHSPQVPSAKSNGAIFVGSTDATYGVNIWRGIKYGKAPVGSLRLQPPVPYKSKGVMNSQLFGNRCFQLGTLVANTSEDCLVLNIYAPSQEYRHLKRHNHGGLPVMVWIHGGGYNRGSGNDYLGQSLVSRSVELDSPVIVVTINYRLSFFGFSAGTSAIANRALNLGLLDQRLALEWVHQNIAAFEGDPRKVTIFGQSAGATSIGLQITAYEGKHQDLFRAAIFESGSPSDTLPTPPPTYAPYQQAWDAVVEGIGCTNNPNLFKCVQNADPQALFAAVNTVSLQSPIIDVTPWQPVIDGKFVADYPSKLTAAGKFAKVPMIMGFTTDEVTYVIPTALNISSDLSIIGLANFVFPFIPIATIQQILALDPLSLYPNTAGVGGSQWKRATIIASDLTERCPGREWIRNVTKYSSAWKYRMNAILPAQLAEAPEEGIVHSADIPYVWGPSFTEFVNQKVDIDLSRAVQKAWISFASHLDPNALGKISPGVSWPQYRNKKQQVLVFQKPDGSAAGSPVGQGSHTEKDTDDRPVCDFYASRDPDFLH